MLSRAARVNTAADVGFALKNATAADFTNLVGEWKVTTSPVHVGNIGHAVAQGKGVNFTGKIEIIFKIRDQKGNDFTGSVETTNQTEALVGSIRKNKTEGIMVHQAGHYGFKIVNANTIDLCYWHFTSESRVTTCYKLKRAH